MYFITVHLLEDKLLILSYMAVTYLLYTPRAHLRELVETVVRVAEVKPVKKRDVVLPLTELLTAGDTSQWVLHSQVHQRR